MKTESKTKFGFRLLKALRPVRNFDRKPLATWSLRFLILFFAVTFNPLFSPPSPSQSLEKISSQVFALHALAPGKQSQWKQICSATLLNIASPTLPGANGVSSSNTANVGRSQKQSTGNSCKLVSNYHCIRSWPAKSRYKITGTGSGLYSGNAGDIVPTSGITPPKGLWTGIVAADPSRDLIELKVPAEVCTSPFLNSSTRLSPARLEHEFADFGQGHEDFRASSDNILGTPSNPKDLTFGGPNYRTVAAGYVFNGNRFHLSHFENQPSYGVGELLTYTRADLSGLAYYYKFRGLDTDRGMSGGVVAEKGGLPLGIIKQVLGASKITRVIPIWQVVDFVQSKEKKFLRENEQDKKVYDAASCGGSGYDDSGGNGYIDGGGNGYIDGDGNIRRSGNGYMDGGKCSNNYNFDVTDFRLRIEDQELSGQSSPQADINRLREFLARFRMTSPKDYYQAYATLSGSSSQSIVISENGQHRWLRSKSSRPVTQIRQWTKNSYTNKKAFNLEQYGYFFEIANSFFVHPVTTEQVYSQPIWIDLKGDFYDGRPLPSINARIRDRVSNVKVSLYCSSKNKNAMVCDSSSKQIRLALSCHSKKINSDCEFLFVFIYRDDEGLLNAKEHRGLMRRRDGAR